MACEVNAFCMLSTDTDNVKQKQSSLHWRSFLQPCHFEFLFNDVYGRFLRQEFLPCELLCYTPPSKK